MLLLTVLACTPAPMPPVPPAAPVLEGDGVLAFDFHWTLKGSAPADTIVRIHLDDACRGPALRDVTSARLSEGVQVDLVSGTANVFSAVSIDAFGVSSACSEPVRVRYERPARPRLQELNLTPALPTRETLFVIRGTAQDAVSVELFEGFSCSGTPIGELSADAFRNLGFSIEVQPNVSRVFVAQALNVLRERSSCSSSVLAVSDQYPPVMQLSILSPKPSPEQKALVAVSYDATFGTTFLGPDCTGPMLGSCSGADCRAFPVQFPMASSSSWSATAVDQLGNDSGCFTAPDSWEWDPLVPTPVLELTRKMHPQFLYGLVPASCAWVEIFDGPVCGDADRLRAFIPGVQLAGPGYYTVNFNQPSDGGVLVARCRSLDLMTASPCSQPVPWY